MERSHRGLLATMSNNPAQNKHQDVLVFIVDDDDFMRSAMRRLFASNGIAAEIYASGMEFLTGAPFDRGGCVILDVRMPGLNGLEVQAQLKQRRIELPVIFLTASADVPIAVSAMREGAVDFLEKPFEKARLLDAIEEAFARLEDTAGRADRAQDAAIAIASLTAREREVLEGLAQGLPNKTIAFDLDISARTVEVHRANLMSKLNVRSLSEALRIAFAAGMGGAGD